MDQLPWQVPSPYRTTSFYPTKNLGGYGDGGAIFTNDDSLAAAIRTITNHGSDGNTIMIPSGSIQDWIASRQLCVAKLAKLDQYNAARKQAADYYDQQLTGIHQSDRSCTHLPFQTMYFISTPYG